MTFQRQATESREECQFQLWWKQDHSNCRYRFRPDQRSTLSRTFLCSRSFRAHRCLNRLCPLRLDKRGRR